MENVRHRLKGIGLIWFILIVVSLIAATIFLYRNKSTELRRRAAEPELKAGKVIFEDDFSTDKGWILSTNNGAHAELENGGYKLWQTVKERNVRLYAPVDKSVIPASYSIETEVRKVSGNNIWYGLLFDVIANDKFYRFLIQPDTQRYLVNKFADGWQTVSEGTSADILGGNQTNLLKLERDGTKIRLYVNGKQIGSEIEDASYVDGGVGLIMRAGLEDGDVPAEAWFDNFKVRNLTGKTGGNSVPIGAYDGKEGEQIQANCLISGWAVDPDDRDADLNIKVLSDGSEIITSVANVPRSDLESLGICPGGTCAIYINLWDKISHNEAHALEIQAQDAQTGEYQNIGSGKTLTCTTPTTPTTVPTKVPTNVPTGIPTPLPTIVPGDVNGDGELSLKDYVRIIELLREKYR